MPHRLQKILVVDDDRSSRELLSMHLEERGFSVLTGADAAEGEALAKGQSPDAIILDVRLPDRSGIELVAQLRRVTDAPVIMITAHHDMATTILAMKSGAFDYILKPIDIGLLDASLNRALEERRVSSDPSTRAAPLEAPAIQDIVGQSRRMQVIFKEIGRIAASRATVLVRGESGTGKELIARVVHRYSAQGRPFIAINCAAVVDTLLESELFGHERGAFTGAVAAKPGKCELAQDGTLFLDEIGDLSHGLQAKLLRVIQEREFERVGGVKRLPFRAQIIAATHHDLEALVRQGRFREDLYQRLKVVTLHLPSLSERPEDIPLLVEHLLSRINAKLNRQVRKVPLEVMDELTRRPWTGNVRELENALTRAVVMAPGDVLLPELLPTPESTPEQDHRDALGRPGGMPPVARWQAPASVAASSVPGPVASGRAAVVDPFATPHPAAAPTSGPYPNSSYPSGPYASDTGTGDEDEPSSPGVPSTHSAVIPTLEEVERDHIRRALAHTGWHRGRTCELLGITRPTLDRKLRKYGLRPER